MSKELPISYIKDGYEVEITPYFLYEISICKIYKNRFETLGCRYVKSEEPITFKKAVYSPYDRKHPPEFRYVKIIDWLGAPEWYIKENNFKLVEHVTNTRRRNKENGISTSGKGGRKKRS